MYFPNTIPWQLWHWLLFYFFKWTFEKTKYCIYDWNSETYNLQGVREITHKKFGGATNFVTLFHIVERIYDGINQVSTLNQIEASQRYMTILRHVHVPFVSHVIILLQSIQKHNHIMCCEHWWIVNSFYLIQPFHSILDQSDACKETQL